MIIKELSPKHPRPSSHAQCDAKVMDEIAKKNEYWFARRKRRATQLGQNWSVEQCQQFGTVMIDDKCYCRKHAGVIALDLWLEGKLVECRT